MQQHTTATISELLSNAGIRPSVQRMAVMRYIISHRTHPSAEEIFAALSPEMPSLSRTTVYNTLRALTDAGLVRQVEAATPDGMSHYDNGLLDDHSHFVCSRCGTIIDLDSPAIELPRSELFKAVSATTIYRGSCARCMASETP